jgi:hypothetical protein
MAVVAKPVDRAIPKINRNASFSSGDTVSVVDYSGQYLSTATVQTGDVIDFVTTLGGAARNTSISALTGSMSVRINPLTNIFPRRDQQGPIDDITFGQPGLRNLTSGVTLINSGVNPVTIPNGGVLVLDNQAVSNLQIVTASGNWTVFIY